jgi:hypothetical protein
MQLDRDARAARHDALADVRRGDLGRLQDAAAARAEPGRPLRVRPGEWTLGSPDDDARIPDDAAPAR